MRRARPALGTIVEIEAEGLSETTLQAAIEEAFRAVDLVMRLMSFHDPASELSLANRGAASAPVRVHPWTARVLRQALAVFEETQGLFDCAVGAELVDWGLLPDHRAELAPAGPGGERARGTARPRKREPWDRARSRPGSLADLRLLPRNRVTYARPLALDLGGIAKGFAVDRAIGALKVHGVKSALVNAGGDLRVFGPVEQPIFIRGGDNRAALKPAGLLRDGAIASSSAGATLTASRGVEVSALVDAETRTPITRRDTYSVIAETCVIADALTKVLAKTGETDAPWMRRFGATGIITRATTASAA